MFRYEFKTNYEEWVKSLKFKLGRVSDHVIAAISTEYDNIKALYKVRTEMRSAFQSLLKVVVFSYACFFYRFSKAVNFHLNYFKLLDYISGGLQIR